MNGDLHAQCTCRQLRNRAVAVSWLRHWRAMILSGIEGKGDDLCKIARGAFWRLHGASLVVRTFTSSLALREKKLSVEAVALATVMCVV